MADELDPALTPEQEPTLPAPETAREPSKFKIVEDDGSEPSGFFGKLGANVREAFDTGTYGTALTGARAIGRVVNDDPEMREYADYLLSQRAKRRYDYEQSRWSETPLEWAGSFTGQMASAIIDPLSYINAIPGVGSIVGVAGGRLMGEVGQRIGTYALSQGVVNAAQDAANQGVEAAAGVKPDYDPTQTAMAFGLGTILGGAFGSLGEIQARYAKYRTVQDGNELAATMRDLENDATIARQDLARAAQDDPTLRSDDLNEITVTKEAPSGRAEEVPAPESVRQPGGIPESVAADQGGVRADPVVGSAVPTAREVAPRAAQEVELPGTFTKASDLALVSRLDGATSDVPPAPYKAPTDVLARDAEQFAQRAVADPAIIQDFSALDVERRGVVLPLVRGLLQDDEVARAVVRLVPVDVMNVLVGKELPPNALFDKPAMLVDLLPVNANDAIPSRVKAADVLAPYVALATAERPLVRPQTASVLRDALAARATAKGDLHVSGKVPYPNVADNAGDVTGARLPQLPAAAKVIADDGTVIPARDYVAKQADAQFVEAIRATPITPELKADLTPPADAKSPAEQIVRAAMDDTHATVADLETAITKAATATAPEGMRVKASSVEEIADVVKSRVVGTDPDLQRRTRTAGQGAPPVGQQTTAAGTTPPAARELLSLQDMTLKLAKDLDLPTLQGRVQGGKAVLGQFDTKQGVSRLRAIADFQTAAHEAAHAIEVRVGKPLMDLVQKYVSELAPLDNTGKGSPREGFAMLIEGDLNNPGYAAANAPGFTAEYLDLMSKRAPKELRAMQDAQAAWQAWSNASKGDKVSAFVKPEEPRGVFDFLKGAKLPQAISLVMSKMTETLTDDLDPVVQGVRELLRQARDAGKVRLSIEGSANPENLVRLFPRSAQAGIRDLLDGVRPYHSVVPEGPSIRDALIMATGQKGLLGSWNGPKVQEFNEYLVLRRAASVYETKFNTKKIANRPVPMDEADVRAQIAEMEALNPNLRPAAQMVHDYTRNILKKMYQGGLIDAELYTTLKAEPFYVPMFRDMRDKPAAAGGGKGGSPDGPGLTQLVKRMKGSDRNVIYPIQSLMTQTLLVNRTLQHNDIIKSFVALARTAQQAGATGTGKILEEIPASRIVGKDFNLQEDIKAAAKQKGIDDMDAKVLSQSVADIFGKDPILGTFYRKDIAAKNGENIVFYKDGGELRAVRFVNKEQGLALYEALTQMPAHVQDVALMLGQASAAALRIGVTTNPVFALTNFIRDQFAAMLLRSNYIPFDPRGIVSELRQDKYAQMYAYAGGVSPGAAAQALDEIVDKHINALARKGWAVQKVGGIADLVQGKGLARLTGPLKAIGETVQVAEMGTRLNIMRTVYEQKLKQGLSEFDAMIEAASQARDILDFGRHGSGTDFIRRLIPFMNAQIQGLSKGYRTAIEPLARAVMGDTLSRQDEAALKNAGLTLFKTIAVGGGAGYMYSLWAQQHRAYQDANEELRATHLIIPGGAYGKPGTILVVPKPFELALGFNLGEMIGLGVGAGDPRWAAMARAGAYEVLAPPNVAESITAVKTPIELKLNKSLFTGRDIVPQKMQAYPADQQVLDNTSSLAKNIAEMLNSVNRKLGKEPSWSPIKIDYAIGAQFSLWGRDAMALSSTVDPDKPAQSDYDQMFRRRFIKRADSASETTKKFWEQAASQNGKLAGASNAYMDLVQSQRDVAALDYLGKLPKPQKVFTILNNAADENGKPAFSAEDRAMHPMVRAAKANSILTGVVRELMKNSQRTYEDGTPIALDPQQRRDVIDNIKQLAAMEQFNALVIAREEGWAGRKLEDTAAQLAVIRAHSPAAADEIATRYATGKIYTTKAVADVWPQIERRLLTDAGQATLSDLTADVVAEGYEFGAERVKKPARRRIEIPRTVAPVQ